MLIPNLLVEMHLCPLCQGNFRQTWIKPISEGYCQPSLWWIPCLLHHPRVLSHSLVRSPSLNLPSLHPDASRWPFCLMFPLHSSLLGPTGVLAITYSTMALDSTTPSFFTPLASLPTVVCGLSSAFGVHLICTMFAL